ncbi:MAG: UDP-3-O-(3-hydroxymyristoyl)glucosamine N-acyltransferase [Candidatus Hydrogenedentes bacterium]|nr:UDP-3-O-(3-hydroxymyristoyl)glucosamine N-acyltransferase [Candidatus Hydrogenedentota bacterium]
MNKTLAEIAELVGGTVIGDGATRIVGVNGIKQANEGELTFVSNLRYLPYLETTRASAAIVGSAVTSAAIPLIQVARPDVAFWTVLKSVADAEVFRPHAGVHPTAVIGAQVQMGKDVSIDAHVRIADGCVIGDGTVIYAGVYVGHGSSIGGNTILYPNVVIREHVTIGARCIVHGGAVIGGDGFGFVPLEKVLYKIPQVGTIEIGDDVEIGSNTTIDRATFGKTVIGRGTKIDNLVQIGHNVEIGEHCVISGTTGISGSAIIGNHVTVGGQVGIGGHIDIGDGAVIAARTGVSKSVRPGAMVSGFPMKDHKRDLRIMACISRLPEIAERVHELEAQIRELNERSDR